MRMEGRVHKAICAQDAKIANITTETNILEGVEVQGVSDDEYQIPSWAKA